MRSVGSSSSGRGIAAVVGVGPKLGRSVARKFAHEGYTVAILARDLGRLSRVAEEIAREEKAQVFAIRIDCSDQRSIREAFEGVLSLGFVEIVVYNAYPTTSSTYRPTTFTDISVDSFQRSLAVSAVGPFLCAQQVIPGMIERGKGTILFTGCSASLNGAAGFSEICCGKFALRALAQCLTREYQAFGIHVAHVIIDGVVGPPRGTITHSRGMVTEQQYKMMKSEGEGEGEGEGESWGETGMDPDTVAQTYWFLHVQDRSAWTHELDLRHSFTRFY
ncbi:PREDICTED: carbonyl reductase family member 4-like [Tarenaya hassleriana]|uniref:carbonyl reductase family member 4-like n=1 Tax=Tarenaya hassleriana TaxID=28532 RepID=UPI00053C73A3|nr:PREDICTED: carbonyl reductase family member 4-like [Tarenaya hassleriana]XP_010558322.1 PREDICTED: carbonyl reductase family member 4-like [Tarenaya hassleriana]